MSTELCEDVVVHLAPQVLPTSTDGTVEGHHGHDCSQSEGGEGQRAGGVELGRRLLLAARAGDTPAVLELMAKGAPFTTDWLGTSPLHLAAANNHVATCAVLLRAGVSRDSRTKVERTPLHLAACAGHAAVVALLLQHGAAVDCRDMLLMTPLHWAAARGRLDAARELLRHGANPRARCKFRKTPRCLALRAQRADLAALLAAAERAPPDRPDRPATEPMIDETPKVQTEFKNVLRLQEIKPYTKLKVQPEKKIIIESKTEPVPASAGVGRGAGGGAAGGGVEGSAAALLRAHGITLLPADRGCTVLSALRSGRTVVLSDAGKLMLKESGTGSSEAPIMDSSNTTPSTATSADVVPASAATGSSTDSSLESVTFSASSMNIVHSSRGTRGGRPARGRGVKMVTLNKNQPLKRIIHPNDLQQVKVVRMPAGSKPPSPARLRPALKIVLDKAHLHRLLAAARPAAGPAAPDVSILSTTSSTSYSISEAGPESEPAATDAGDSSLRAQLDDARAALASLGAELRACRARLAQYEGTH